MSSTSAGLFLTANGSKAAAVGVATANPILIVGGVAAMVLGVVAFSSDGESEEKKDD